MTNKTVASSGSVNDFISGLTNSEQQADTQKLIELCSEVSAQPPVMWGSSIIGFGSAHLTYASGRETDWPVLGFSPRKGKFALYITFNAEGFMANFPALGKYKTTKGCIYINKLRDISLDELEKMLRVAWEAGFESPKRSDGKEQIISAE